MRLKRTAEEDGAGFFCCLTMAVLVVVLGLLPLTAPASESKASTQISFDIPRQRADQALIEFAEQADVTFIFPFDEARQKTAKHLVGNYTLKEAIKVLLQGTGLQPEFRIDGGMTIRSDADRKSVV